MKTGVVVTFGGLDRAAAARLPGWTAPFVIRLVERVRVKAADRSLALTVVPVEDGARLEDGSPGAFGREFGAPDRAADPGLSDAVADAILEPEDAA